jgi:hypothetical protein
MSRDAAMAAETDESKTAGGLTVYLGVVPAEIVKGPPTHVLLSKGPHEYDIMSKSPHDYQIVAAIFDAASGERVSHVIVTAEVFGLGLSGSKKQLEPMQIAGTAAYGGFFDLPGSDLYTVKLTVERSGTNPAVLQFKYDHRLDSPHVFEHVSFSFLKSPIARPAQGSVGQKYTRRAQQQKVMCYSTKYPFAQAGMPVGSCDDEIGLSLVSDTIQLAAGVTGSQFDPSRR